MHEVLDLRFQQVTISHGPRSPRFLTPTIGDPHPYVERARSVAPPSDHWSPPGDHRTYHPYAGIDRALGTPTRVLQGTVGKRKVGSRKCRGRSGNWPPLGCVVVCPYLLLPVSVTVLDCVGPFLAVRSLIQGVSVCRVYRPGLGLLEVTLPLLIYFWGGRRLRRWCGRGPFRSINVGRLREK